MKWSPPSASSFAPDAITSAAAASIAGATVSGWCGSSMASPRSTTASAAKRSNPQGNAFSSASCTDAARIARGPSRQPGR